MFSTFCWRQRTDGGTSRPNQVWIAGTVLLITNTIPHGTSNQTLDAWDSSEAEVRQNDNGDNIIYY